MLFVSLTSISVFHACVYLHMWCVCVLSAWVLQYDPYQSLLGLILSDFIKNVRTSSSIILSLLLYFALLFLYISYLDILSIPQHSVITRWLILIATHPMRFNLLCKPEFSFYIMIFCLKNFCWYFLNFWFTGD